MRSNKARLPLLLPSKCPYPKQGFPPSIIVYPVLDRVFGWSRDVGSETESSIIVLLVINADFFLVEVFLLVRCNFGLWFARRCSFLVLIFFIFIFLVFFVLLGLCAVVYLLGWFGRKLLL